MLISKSLILKLITNYISICYKHVKDIKDLKPIKKKTTIKRSLGVEINN